MKVTIEDKYEYPNNLQLMTSGQVAIVGPGNVLNSKDYGKRTILKAYDQWIDLEHPGWTWRSFSKEIPCRILPIGTRIILEIEEE